MIGKSLSERMNDKDRSGKDTRERDIRADERQKIAKMLRGLERRLAIEIRRTGDPELRARRGIYEGIAEDILSCKHNEWRDQ